MFTLSPTSLFTFFIVLNTTYHSLLCMLPESSTTMWTPWEQDVAESLRSPGGENSKKRHTLDIADWVSKWTYLLGFYLISLTANC